MTMKKIYILLFSILIITGSLVFLKYFHLENIGTGRLKTVRNYDSSRIYTRPALSYAPAGHIICLLGRGESITAISGGLLRDKLLLKYFPFIKKLPVIKRGGAINLEETLKNRPDILFISPETASDERAVNKLKLTGIPFYAPSFNTMEEQISAVNEIGKILGREKRAGEYEKFYHTVLEIVGKRLETVKEKKRVYYSILEVNRTFGENTLGYYWLGAAGLVNNVLDEKLKISNNKYFISLEQIIAMDPEIILANEESAEKEILTSKKFRSIDAVKNRRVYKMPNGISRWGHSTSVETPLAILWTAMKVYPGRFTDIDIEKSVKDFYKRFFNIELDKNTIGKIIRGRGMRYAKSTNKH
jgi:iron complex transport system substrate-binding protein